MGCCLKLKYLCTVTTNNTNMNNQPPQPIDTVQNKYGPKDWEEFDHLEQQQRNIMSNSPSQQHDVTKKGKKKKPTKTQRKLKVIDQYQTALKRLREGGQQFYNPFQRHKLNIQQMPVLKMLQKAFETEYNLEEVLKKMGLKTSKILFKCGAKNNIGFMLIYLREGLVPAWLIQRHRQMMKKRDDQFDNDQNTLLRTMSNSDNECLNFGERDKERQRQRQRQIQQQRARQANKARQSKR